MEGVDVDSVLSMGNLYRGPNRLIFTPNICTLYSCIVSGFTVAILFVTTQMDWNFFTLTRTKPTTKEEKNKGEG